MQLSYRSGRGPKPLNPKDFSSTRGLLNMVSTRPEAVEVPEEGGPRQVYRHFGRDEHPRQPGVAVDVDGLVCDWFELERC